MKKNQVEITKEIKNIANNFHQKDHGLLFEILSWINKNIEYKRLPGKEKDILFRNRTSQEIIDSGFSTGCTDFTLVFLALSRAKGIQSQYIEMLERDWLLQKKDNSPVKGHVIAEVNLYGQRYYIDPTISSISLKFPSGMVLYDKGQDSWDIGIDNINWKDRFLTFKKRYLTQDNPPKQPC